MVGKHASVAERLWRNCMPEPMSGCWIWMGSLNKNGYGQIAMPKGPERAHCVSYKTHKGPLFSGLDVRHTCDMRCCINPDHLVLGTRKQNMADADQRGRIARGFKLPHTKLSCEQTAAIVADPRKQKAIAANYGIHPAYVSMLKSGQRRGKSR